MALIVEDGSCVPNSNTYVTIAEFLQYTSDRGITIDSSKAEQYLILAMDYLETLDYIGVKTESDQSLEWPRKGFWGEMCGQLYIDNYAIDSHEIPEILKKGQMETALQVSKGNDPLQDVPRQVISEKVDVLEVHYSENATATVMPIKIMRILSKLLATGGTGGGNFTVSR